MVKQISEENTFVCKMRKIDFLNTWWSFPKKVFVYVFIFLLKFIRSLCLNSSVFFAFLSLKFFLFIESILFSTSRSTEVAYENQDEFDADQYNEGNHLIVLLWLIIHSSRFSLPELSKWLVFSVLHDGKNSEEVHSDESGKGTIETAVC